MINIKKYIKLIGNILTVFSIIFLIVAMIKLDIDFSQIQNIVCFVWISIIGSVSVALTVYAMAFAWKIILEKLSGKKLSLMSTVKVYAKSNMGKYLPGNVMHYVERNIFAAKMELNQLEIAAGSIIEVGTMILTAILFSIMISYRDFLNVLWQIINYKTIFVFIVAVVILLVIVVCLYIRYSKFQSLIKVIFRPRFLSVIGKIMPIYMMVLLCFGMVLLFVCRYVLACEMSMEESLVMVSVFILAWLFGFIVPGAPGGIGIREFVLVLLLSAMIGETNILFAALIHRMISTIGDILAYIVSVLIREKGQKI